MKGLISTTLALTLFPATICGQVIGTTAPLVSQQIASGQQNMPPLPPTISLAGLLPVFAVDAEINPSWIDAANVPSKLPQYSHSGVNDTLQQVWTALRAGGFSVIRFPLDVGDPQAATRLANLCIWSKTNNVSLIPILKIAGDNAQDKSLTTAASTFVAALVSGLRNAQQLPAYTQILYYHLGDPMNHMGLHPNTTASAATQTLLGAANALRISEAQALQGSGIQATPIMVSASFDYELIRYGGIAGVPLDGTTEQNSQASLRQSLSLLSTANIEAVSVEWFPRSISTGDIDHFASLLHLLENALPGKQIILTTGFSSAFHTADQQTQFLTLTVSNLAAFRTSDAANRQFLGLVFRQAFSGPTADAKVPDGIGDPMQWNWSEKGQQLSQMWSQGAKSAELTWWLNKVQDSMGLLALQPNGSGGTNVVALPGAQVFQQISTTVAQVSQNVVPPGSVPALQSFIPPTTMPGAPQSLPPTGQFGGQTFVPSTPLPPVSSGITPTSSSYPSNLSYPAGSQAPGMNSASSAQQILFTLLQQVATQLTNSLTSKLTNAPGTGMASQYSGYPGTSPGQSNSSLALSQSPYGTANGAVPNYGPNLSNSQPPFSPVSNANATPNVPATYPALSGTPIPSYPAGSATSSSTNMSLAGSSVPPSITTLDANSQSTSWQSPNSNLSTPPITSPQVQMSVGSVLTGTINTANTPAGSAALGGPPTAATPGTTTTPAPAVPVRPGPGTAITTVIPMNASGPTASASTAASPLSQLGNTPSRPGPSGAGAAPIPATMNVPTRPGPTGSAAPAVLASGNVPLRPGPASGVTTSTPSAGLPQPISGALARPGPRNRIEGVNQGGNGALFPAAARPSDAHGFVDLSVSNADIRVVSNPPRPGQATSFAVVVHNLGTQDARGAAIVFRLVADGRQVAISQPLMFDVAAHGTYQGSWSSPTLLSMGTGSQALQVGVVVSFAGDVNPANNAAMLSFTLAPGSQPRR